MNNKSIAVCALSFGLMIAACGAPPTHAPNPSASLGKPFTLAVDQSATLADAPITLKFVAVSEDSRCPKKVNCVWSGQAVISLSAQTNGSAPQPLILSTIHSPEKTDRVAFVGYQIVLQDVQPYPETPDNPIKPEDYRVTFVVTRGKP